MKSSTVVIDCGHGMNKEGVYSRPLIDCRNGQAIIVPNSMSPHPLDHVPWVYREDFGTVELGKVVKSYLELKGHSVFLTRDTDKNVEWNLPDELNANEWKRQYWKSWKWINEFARVKKSDVFVSIHTNADKATGCSAFWAEPAGVKLCESITKELNKQAGLKIRRIEKHKYSILRDHSKGRAILLETLFHDTYNDIRLLLEPNGYERIGSIIGEGIENFLKTL
jgi:N-acetylmuramoyl-L-alanine amidase